MSGTAAGGSACLLCDPTPGPTIGASRAAEVASWEHWILTVFPGFDVPGWYFLQSRRHVTQLDELDAGEQMSLGPALSSAVGSIRSSLPCDKVYVQRFGESYPHWHMLLCAVPDGLPADARGAALFPRRAELRDDQRTIAVAAAVARALGGTGSNGHEEMPACPT